MGTGGALVEPDVRGRVGGDRTLGGVSVRARVRARAARALVAAVGSAVALRRPRRGHGGGEPTGVRAARAHACRSRRHAARGRGSPGRRGGARCRRARRVASLPRRPLSVPSCGARGRVHVLRARNRAHTWGRTRARTAGGVRRRTRGVRRVLRRAFSSRREHRALPLRRDPPRRPRRVVARVAAAPCGRRRPRARGIVESDSPRVGLREGRVGSLRKRRVLGRGGAAVIRMTQTRLELAVSRAGWYRVAVRYSPYWRALDGCTARSADGMTKVWVPRAGVEELSFDLQAGRALGVLVGTAATDFCST